MESIKPQRPSFVRAVRNPGTVHLRSGAPFTTGAVVQPTPPDAFVPSEGIPRFNLVRDGDWTKLFLPLGPHDRVFGLGEMLGGLDKRGFRYRLFAKDEPHHTPDKQSLYGSHPFVIVDGERPFAFFLDYPGEIYFDIGFRRLDEMEMSFSSLDFDLYLFDGDSIADLVRRYLELTGAPYVPPKWAFGYQQCRYSYETEAEVREVARRIREHRLPCDAVYLDIDYMEDYKVFTVDRDTFPSLEGLVRDLAADGFQVVPIIDPGVKIEQGYDVYESGLAARAFCTDAAGAPFTGAVWPGLVHFPDFLNGEGRRWWGSLYRRFTDIGIGHFWNDMNEPAIFYTPQGLEMLRSQVASIPESRSLEKEAVDFLHALGSFWANEQYLSQLYHRLDDGSVVRHREVHNLYGTGMALATAEGVADLLPGKRSFLLARSSYSGAHRFCAIWTGDSHSWWEHIPAQIRLLLSLNLAGFFFTGGDVGGFSGDASPELIVRWTQFGVFNPLFRNHSTKGSRRQEPWEFGERVLSCIRGALELRYALLPYAYSEFHHARRDLRPFVAPLFLHFAGARVKEIDDQLMYGRSIMAAPVYRPGAEGRFVHLPECRWLCWHAKGGSLDAVEVMAPGEHYVRCPLEETLVFIRENHLLALTEPVQYVGASCPTTLTVVGLVTAEASCVVYDDDGVSTAYLRGESSTLALSVKRAEGRFEVESRCDEHGYRSEIRTVSFVLFEPDGHCHRFEHEVGSSTVHRV